MANSNLNQSQRAIVLSERTFSKRALNVISLKLWLPGVSAERAEKAAEEVFHSGDIFTAVLHVENGETYFVPGEKEVSGCVMLQEMTKEAARHYTDEKDQTPLRYPEELYEACIMPLKESGVLLYVRFHHVIIDGYGMSLFAQRVLDVLAGKALEESRFFVRGDGEDAKGAEKSSRFWQEYFAHVEFEPVQCADSVKSMKKVSGSFCMEQELWKRIESYAGEQGVTVPYVLGGAYAVYLTEALGREDAVFLMPRLNREQEELGILGCYTLLVPVRVRIAGNDTFGDVCRKVQEASRLAALHKRDGFDNILQALKEVHLNFDNISGYAFNYYSYIMRTDMEYALEFSVAGEMQNNFRWNLFRQPEGLAFTIDVREGGYDGDDGEKARAEYFAAGVSEILRQGMEDARVDSISVIGEAEKNRLSAIKGETQVLDEEATIPSLFQEVVFQYGHRPALYAGDEEYSFTELDKASGAVAMGLTEKGVQSGDSVAFMLKRDIRLIPIMLGIAKTGAAFIPVDPMYPMDRVKYILEDSGAKYLISSKDVESAAGYEYLEADDLLACNGEGFVPPQISQGQTAYIIYTSGTTGRPKGVMLSHRGIVNIVRPQNNPFNRDITENGNGIVAIGSICFDISLYEIFVTLFNGLFVELGNEKAMLDSGELAKHISRHGADFLHCTPSRVASYLANPEFAEALKGVKAMLMAGEVLPESLVRELKECYGIRVYNGYGPTETTIGATMTEAGDAKTIGKPMANMGILLLNTNRKQVPFGDVGEICVYGEGLGIGYKGRPQETADKFIVWNGMRIYRTGDLGQFASDGRLIYHGRNDRQIKLRGLRIELSEIEKVMDAYRGTAQVSCVVRKIGGTEHLAGFYTVEKGRVVEEERLREFMKDRLTPYMVPDILKELEEMPQTPGGKTDLKALLEVPVEYVRSYRAPENETEEAVCRVFAQVLGVEQAGVDDNFFELGGDSLSAVELIAALEKALEEEAEGLDYESLFRYPTPALLALKIKGNEKEQKPYPIEQLDYTGIDAYLQAYVRPEGDTDTRKRNEQGDADGGSDTRKRNGQGDADGGLDTRKGNGLGNVLLTGATGYLGIHIFIDLLQNPGTCNKIYCLARGKGKLSALKRVKNALFYYAEEDFTESMGEKWEVVEGDITNPQIFLEPFEGHIDTIINSAANVAHFAYGDTLERVNRNGVHHLMAYAASQRSLLCQVSTISVGGVSEDAAGREYSEDNFYVGQKIFNQYIYSKYMAEYELLRGAVDQGLSVKLMRVGNLQGRSRDGEFQMNLKSNGFTRRLSAYIKMGAVPESVYHASVNFSPVDETAHMIIALAGTESCYSAFHVYPPEEVAFERLFAALEKQGHKIEVLTDEAFTVRLQELKQTEEGRMLIEGLLTDSPGGVYQDIPVVQKVTNGLLDAMGEKWQPVTDAYLNQYLAALEGMNMF